MLNVNVASFRGATYHASKNLVLNVNVASFRGETYHASKEFSA